MLSAMYHSGLATESFSSNDHVETPIYHIMWLELVVSRLPVRGKNANPCFLLELHSPVSQQSYSGL